MDVIEAAAKMELAGLRHVDFKRIGDSPLSRQEIHVGISPGRVEFLRQHEMQKEPRLNVLKEMISNCGADWKNINCEMIFNMCDYTHISDSSAPRLSFTKEDGSHNILIPDAHFLNVCSTVKAVKRVDKHFDGKKNAAIFAGSDTGWSTDPATNQRFQFCYQNRHDSRGRFKITNFVEMDKSKFKDYSMIDVYDQLIPIEEQLKYKFIININGNSTSWDRLLWAMSSQSICLYVRPVTRQRSWYYHIFDMLGGPVMVDQDSWKVVMDMLLENETMAKEINVRQQTMALIIANRENQLRYFRHILEGYNNVYNKL